MIKDFGPRTPEELRRVIKLFTHKDNVRFNLVPRPAILFIKGILKGPLVGVEIGVLEGKNARNMLQVLNIKKLYLVDPVCKYEGKEFKDKIIWVKKKSSDAVSDIPDNLDFVYIDGNHVYDFVKQDVENYWPKIKKGGVLSGHDYYTDYHRFGVTPAVDEFVKKNNLKLQTKTPDWWIVK